VVRAMGTPGGPRAQPCHGLPQVALGVPHHALDSRRFTPWMGPHVLDCQGACLPCAHPRGLHPTNPLQILRLPGLWDRALKGMHRIPTGLPIHPMQGSEGLVHGMSGPRGTFPEGPFRGDRSRIYDVCKSASFRSEAKASIPAITARPSLFARSSTRWRMASIARDLAQSDRAAKRGIEPCSRRAYPVHDETRGEFHPSRP